MVENLEADYVIVGAGSSGCALAGRLVERTNDRVLLIEAGGRNEERLISTPLGVSKVIGDPRFDWRFTTEPQPGLDGRRLDYPRGKGLGGSSAINWMAHVRGTRADYDGWRDAGCPGWDWATLLPYFNRMEDYADGRGGRGRGGPLKVTDIDYCHPIIDRLTEASLQAGIPATDDYNGADAVGMSRTQLTVRKGRRCSSYVAYIRPLLRRFNLQILTDTEVLRIEFKSGRALGVEIRRGGHTARVSARREVIVSAGAIGTPVLLERSGIGHADQVATLGAPLVHHAPQVGENLQDQMVGWVKLRLNGVGSLNQEIRGWRLLRHIAQYALFRKGMLAGVPTHSQGFARASPGDGLPDIQLLGLPITYTYSLSNTGEPTLSVDREAGISLAFLLSRPESRGYAHAAADSGAPPRISPNFLKAESDQKLVVAGLRLCRRIFQQRAFDQIRGVELAPGSTVQTDEDLLSYARSVGHSSYHPVGTCRMGSDDAAVLDPQLRVRGVGGLRVVDASVMPRIVSGNTNAAAILIGERAADLVMSDS